MRGKVRVGGGRRNEVKHCTDQSFGTPCTCTGEGGDGE